MENENQNNGQGGNMSQSSNQPEGMKGQPTLKEQREIKHQQKLAKRSEADVIAMKERWYRVILWTFVVIVLCGAIFAMIKLAGSNGPGAGADEGTGPNGGTMTNVMSTVTSADWVRDNLNASTTLIEYGDFQCPACGAYYPITKQIDQQFGKQIRFIFREFPLSELHPNAEIGAQAAEAAGDQGQDKFWLMHDLLYQNQDNWADLSNSGAEAIFTQYAQQIGLNMTQYQTDFASSATAQKITDSYNEGISLGIDATPTFFLDGEKLNPPDTIPDFMNEISNAIQKDNGTTTSTTSTTSAGTK